nr:RNA-directed DNA polymerase, eukaryota, reverse transcriptase zinc-binding domain protein [Tanacetum cinerariifolium]
MNIVHNKNERSGSLFSQLDADNFNSFIDNSSLINLPLGGRLFTWMNKAGTRVSIEEKIEAGSTNDDDHDSHIKLLQEVDILDTFESFDIFQKARIKRDIEDEVKNAVWDCSSSKAPSPYGFSFAFVKIYWGYIKVDILEYVNFFYTGLFPHGSNSSFFTLSLKKKAFDSVSWKYLDFVLLNLGFGSKWRSWIRACLSSSRALILISGSPTSEFSIKHGLRQGDPLSPFIFILVMEGLHNAISTAVSSGLIRGVKFGSPEMSNIMALGFWMSMSLPWPIILDALQDPFLLLILGYPLGRYTLIKVVLGSLGIYYFSIFKVPESVLNSLERYQAMFFREILPSLALSTVWDKNISQKAISYPSCNGNMESSNHIFSECNITKDIWMLVVKEKSRRLSVIFLLVFGGFNSLQPKFDQTSKISKSVFISNYLMIAQIGIFGRPKAPTFQKDKPMSSGNVTGFRQHNVQYHGGSNVTILTPPFLLKPTMVLDDSCLVNRDLVNCVMGEVL